MTKTENYDLALVLEHFRTCHYYLSIIQQLAGSHRIALYKVPIHWGAARKNMVAQRQFENLCAQYGADICEAGMPISTNVVIVPQRLYSPESIASIRNDIHYKKMIGFLGFAWAGIEKYDHFLDELDIRRVYVIDKQFFNFLVTRRKAENRYNNREIIEVGLPFKKYPILKQVIADFIIAMPTPFSFESNQDKIAFLETVDSLLSKIEPNDTVFHKPHNSLGFDYFVSNYYLQVARILKKFVVIRQGLRKLISITKPPKIRRQLEVLYIAILYQKLLDRTGQFKDYESLNNFSLEILLPHIRKGVIGGLSNTMWSSLFFSLPFYNCVKINHADRNNLPPEDRLLKSKEAKYLPTNLEYYAVPYCASELVFDVNHYDKIAYTTRHADLIHILESDILKNREQISINSIIHKER